MKKLSQLDLSNVKSVMLDFDGTITEKGEFKPSPEMVQVLFKTAKHMPIAFCTGRQLESFYEDGIVSMLEVLDKKHHDDFLKNVYLIAENGSIGYYYDAQKGSFLEFYRMEWPQKFVEREEMFKELERIVSGVGEVYRSHHRVICVVRPEHGDDLYTKKGLERIYKDSGRICDRIHQFLEGIGKDYQDYFHIGNSGIGVVVVPANGDKDNGIKMFAERLISDRGYEFEDKYREILAIGDSPQVGGNDHYFLSGKYATPFNVGYFVEGADHLNSVIGEDEIRVENSKATMKLLLKVLEDQDLN